MLKFENIAKVGDVIRSYDFKPMIGRDDCFVEGEVLAIDASQGYKAYKIRVSKDVFDKKEYTAFGYGSRVTKEVFVPMQVSFMEYDARIINLSK